jgi:predicted AlkP superfamily pyrophosphatase or phosphodiesterase
MAAHAGAQAPEAQAPGAPASPPAHVVLISIDGLRPAVYLEPERLQLSMPHLVALRDRGTAAEAMVPVFPSVTYPAHTTLITGATPATHGIVSNFKSGQRWYLEAADVRARTLYQAAADLGMVTAIVTWPATVGARVDFLIPENLSFGVRDLPALISAGSTPGLFEELTGKLGRFEIPSFEAPDAGEKLDRMTAAFAAELLRAHKPALLLVHFLDADHHQHSDGPDSPAARAAFERIDAHVGALVAAAAEAGIGEATSFAIVGDHGFAPVHTAINLIGLLTEAGYGELSEGGSAEAAISTIPLAIGGAAAVYARDPSDTALATALDQALRAQIDRHYHGLIDVLSAEELRRLGAFPGAILGLSAAPGYMFNALPRAQVLSPSAPMQGMHGYGPTLPAMATGFILAGPRARAGLRVPLVRQLDVAPTLARILGVDLGSTEGRVIEGILASAPAPTAAPAAAPAPGGAQGGGSPPAQR